ncbi:N-acetylmuramoyl-L-alanine amidase-like domain-containing protein [Mycobacteroides salmoniphilum]|nr:N-acetylmuramoyl-L-alanine amidase-like domain-containing protein [Mycobacteroides salmoniphilum]
MMTTTKRCVLEPLRFCLFVLLALMCALCASTVASADAVHISPENERRLQGLLAERNRLATDNPAKLSAAVSALFLHVPYGADTLIGSASVPEQLVVELSRVDCFTYVDYVEALKRSSNSADFIAQLTQIRYRGGDISFTQRRHFFTDWAADAPVNATDVTASLGVPTEQVAKTLNLKDSGGSYLPGLPPRQRTVVYLPSARVSDGVIANLHDGDYLGAYATAGGLDVTHVGIFLHTPSGPVLRNASSLRANNQVVDTPLGEYLGTVPGIVVLRPTR